MLTRTLLTSAILVFWPAILPPSAAADLEPDYPVYQALYHTAAVSADGKVTALGTHRGIVYVWDTGFKTRLQTLGGHAGGITGIALTADGGRVVTGSDNHTAILWDVATGNRVHTLSGHTDTVGCVAITADGKRILTGSADHTAIIWDAETGKKIHTFADHGDAIVAVAMASDGSRVLTATMDSATIWDGNSHKQLHKLKTENTYSAAMSADGKLVVTGDGEVSVQLWDATTGERLRTLKTETGSTEHVAISGDGKIAFAGGSQGFDIGQTVSWDTASGKQLQKFEWHKYGAADVATTGDGKRLLIAGMSGAYFADTGTGENIHVHREYFNPPVSSLALSTDGRQLLAGFWGGTAVLWDLAAGKRLHVLQAKQRSADCTAISADGKWLAIGGFKGATVFEAATGKSVQTFDVADRASVTGITFSADGKRVMIEVGTSRRSFDIADGKPTGADKEDGEAASLRPVRREGAVALVDRSDKTVQTLKDDPGEMHRWTVSTNGKWLLTTTMDGRVVLWDTASGAKVQTFDRGKQLVAGLAVSADGKQVWTGSQFGVMLWDSGTGKQLCAIASYAAGHEWLIVTPNGYFDGSKRGLMHMAWKLGDQRVDDEVTFRKHLRPGLLPAVIKGEALKE